MWVWYCQENNLIFSVWTEKELGIKSYVKKGTVIKDYLSKPLL